MNKMLIKPIARIYNAYTSKFAIPRQSGISKSIKSEIVFEEDYRIEEAIRGIDGFSHLWLIWGFSQVPEGKWSPTVRPPKLGGNKRVGVFATRSPFRPNGLGLSSVRLEEIKKSAQNGTYLVVNGADILNGTPIYDIKPYLPHADCKPDATGGFSTDAAKYSLDVVIPTELEEKIEENLRAPLRELLSQDPRPGYAEDGDRVYGFTYGRHEISFTVADGTLTVCDVKNNK